MKLQYVLLNLFCFFTSRQDEAPIYQWVPPNEPQVQKNIIALASTCSDNGKLFSLSLKILSARFEDHINLGYRATTDPLSERRALHLVDLTTEHSGRYSCRVSSNHQDEFRAKDMVIYGERDLRSTFAWQRTYKFPTKPIFLIIARRCQLPACVHVASVDNTMMYVRTCRRTCVLSVLV